MADIECGKIITINAGAMETQTKRTNGGFYNIP